MEVFFGTITACSSNKYHVVGTRQRGGVPEGSHLRVRQSSEEGDHSVHHVLVIDDAILTLADQNADKFAEVVTELFPHRSWHGERIIPTILLKKDKNK